MLMKFFYNKTVRIKPYSKKIGPKSVRLKTNRRIVLCLALISLNLWGLFSLYVNHSFVPKSWQIAYQQIQSQWSTKNHWPTPKFYFKPLNPLMIGPDKDLLLVQTGLDLDQAIELKAKLLLEGKIPTITKYLKDQESRYRVSINKD